MITVPALWLPILLSAVAVFLASWLLHMFLKYHDTNYAKLAVEDDVRAALRSFNIAPGEYSVPHATSATSMSSPEYRAKLEEGPVLLMTVMPNAMFNMGKSLGLWFVYCLVAGVFVAYLAGRLLDPGIEYLEVFRVTGTTAFLAYGLALAQDSIWFGRKWSTTAKHLLDAIIYALLTAGIFGWLWPGT